MDDSCCVVKGLQPVHPSILKTFFPAVAAAIWRLFSSISALVTPHSSTLYIADAYLRLCSKFGDLSTPKKKSQKFLGCYEYLFTICSNTFFSTIRLELWTVLSKICQATLQGDKKDFFMVHTPFTRNLFLSSSTYITGCLSKFGLAHKSKVKRWNWTTDFIRLALFEFLYFCSTVPSHCSTCWTTAFIINTTSHQQKTISHFLSAF